MQGEALLGRLCGFADDGRRVRLYFDDPVPLPALGRQHGVRSGVFRDLTGPEASAFRDYLVCNPGWEYLRIDSTPARGHRSPARPSSLLAARGGNQRGRPAGAAAGRAGRGPAEPGSGKASPPANQEPALA